VTFRILRLGRHTNSAAAAVASGVLIVMGCSPHPPGIAGIQIDTGEVSQAIFLAHDKDQNGLLSAEELTAVPAIGGNRSWYDTDHDGQLSASELEAGLKAIFDPRVGLLTYSCGVTRKGQPLAGATVKFVPLPALKDVLPPASGVTDKRGHVDLALAPEDLPANAPTRVPELRPGLYFVEVTHPTISIPDQYNVNTTLGEEVSRFTTVGGGKEIRLDF
jgi:EF hand